MSIVEKIGKNFHSEHCVEIIDLSVCGDLPQADFCGYGNVYLHEAGGYLCAFMPYIPHIVSEPSIAFVDSYFWVSQKIYKIKNELIDFLRASGYPLCCTFKGDYKKLVMSLGIGRILHNTLLWIKPFGTFFCMEIIDLTGAGLEGLTAPVVDESADCLHCGKCSAACPAGAMTVDGFIREKCIRQKQFEKASLADPANLAIGNRLLGCNECQSACPMNSGVIAKASKPGGSYYRMFDLDSLALACCDGSFKKGEYVNIFGVNYLKPMKVLSQVLVLMKNDPSSDHANAVKKCLETGNPNAMEMLEEYLND